MEGRKKHRLITIGISFLALICIGHAATANQTREDTKTKLAALVQKGDWPALAKAIETTEGNPSLQDIALYYKGQLYLNTSPGPDPDQFLSRVPPESDLFEKAQQSRLLLYDRSQDPRLKAAILSALDRANKRNPVYYILKLGPPPLLSYDQTVSLESEFRSRNASIYNFSELRAKAPAVSATHVSSSKDDIAEIPGALFYFYYLEMMTAQQECRADRKQETLRRYRELLQKVGTPALNTAIQSLYMNQYKRIELEATAAAPLASTCHA